MTNPGWGNWQEFSSQDMRDENDCPIVPGHSEEATAQLASLTEAGQFCPECLKHGVYTWLDGEPPEPCKFCRRREVNSMPSKDGKYIRCPRVRVNGKKKEISRMIMEKMLGRSLYDNEVVHHIDRDTSNNKKENLQLMTKSEHAKLHNPRIYSRYGISAAENKQFWMKHYNKEKNPDYGKRLKVTPDILMKVKQKIAEGFKQKEISKLFNIDQSAVSRIKNGTRYNTGHGWMVNRKEVKYYGTEQGR